MLEAFKARFNELNEAFCENLRKQMNGGFKEPDEYQKKV